jgi:hypothetical protein
VTETHTKLPEIFLEILRKLSGEINMFSSSNAWFWHVREIKRFPLHDKHILNGMIRAKRALHAADLNKKDQELFTCRSTENGPFTCIAQSYSCYAGLFFLTKVHCLIKDFGEIVGRVDLLIDIISDTLAAVSPRSASFLG